MPPSVQEQVALLVGLAFEALEGSSAGRADAACDGIVALAGTPGRRRLVTRSLTELLAAHVEASWRRGWQPIDLYRHGARSLGGDVQPLVADALAHELGRYAIGTIAPRWQGQLRETDASVWWPADSDPIDARARITPGGLLLIVPLVVRLAHLLARLPALERHDPLPGTARPEPPRREGADVDERILSRVRALLAKAESTTFEAEAETFTAGAQALMSRHSIDAAMLAASSPTSGKPHGRRVWIERPYEPPKVLLLDVVATANRCRSVWTRRIGFVTVIGFDADIDAAETIFTSLLVQANHAVSGQGSRSTRYGQSRTRAFRQSFLTAYAHRIGERLREVTEEETASAVSRASGTDEGSGRELVRVLGARAQAVDDSLADLFPAIVTKSIGSTNDAEGWHAGREAADRATLFGAGRVLPE
ncbi:MAG: DUF2786 domain-containing protein [Nostocoides sp.]